ncbi:AAA family ATPase [Thermocatellispora tengchongensis]|uniref:AAA family ATPase n=1 Tax=Thermocatellispora tengchongensis TaxID=1073253 RepID=UPI003642A631
MTRNGCPINADHTIFGRDEELQRIGRLFDQVHRGRGGALVIRGEAGVGKSALLREARRRAGQGLTFLVTAGVESEIRLAFSGLHQLLAPVLDSLDLLPEEQAQALRCALGLRRGQTTELLVCAAFTALLRRLSEAGPVVVVADDAHALDRASTAVLLFAARRLTGTGAGMLIAVQDPGEAELETADLAEIRLHGLDAEVVARLAQAAGWEVDRPTIDVLTQATGGNPLALTTLARAGDWERLVPVSLLTGTVPLDATLRAMFVRRLGSLPEQAHDALLVAAAEESGRVSVVLAATAGLGAPQDALDAAERAGLIDVFGHELRFRHPLIRSAAYQSASAGRRRAAHAALASVLAARGENGRARRHRALAAVDPDDALAAELERDAHEMTARGGMAATASTLHQAALLSSQPAERVRRLTLAAYAAWKSGHDRYARSLLAAADRSLADPGTEQEMVRLRGLVEFYSGDQVTAYDYATRTAAELAGKSADHAAEMLFIALETAVYTDRLPWAAAAADRLAELPGGYQRYGLLLAAAVRGLPDPATADPWWVFDRAPAAIHPSNAHSWLYAMAINWRGPDPSQAREFGLVACDHLMDAGMRAIIAIPLCWLAELEYRLGLWAEAEEHAMQAYEVAGEVNQRPRAADAAAMLALLAAARGGRADCGRHARRALELAAPVRNRLAAAQATWALGLRDLAHGRPESAAATLRSLHLAGSARHHEQVSALAIGDTVEAHVRAGLTGEAARLATEHERRTATTGTPLARACLHRCRALLAGDIDRADEDFRAALSIPGADHRPFEYARTALLHGQWLRRHRRVRDARVSLRQALEQFERLGARPWAAQARAELRSCGGEPAPVARGRRSRRRSGRWPGSPRRGSPTRRSAPGCSWG